jgi:tRNA (guanine26-N2/guanine27-N2)-dimethyltransferase
MYLTNCLLRVRLQGLRLVLHSLATTAARYGRYIEPQLSLSIDFYVRLFIRVRTGPKEVKAVPS